MAARTATASSPRATAAAPTSEPSFPPSFAVYPSDLVDPLSLSTICLWPARGACLVHPARRFLVSGVPTRRWASSSMSYPFQSWLLSSCDQVASMQTHRSPSWHGWCIICVRARQACDGLYDMHASVMMQAIAAMEIAGLLVTWHCLCFVRLYCCAWTTAFIWDSELLCLPWLLLYVGRVVSSDCNAHMFSNQQCICFRNSWDEIFYSLASVAKSNFRILLSQVYESMYPCQTVTVSNSLLGLFQYWTRWIVEYLSMLQYSVY
jgi:hypothetical protein